MRRRIDYRDYMKRNKTYEVETKDKKVIGVINHINTNHETLHIFEEGTFEECKFPVEDILKVTAIQD